MSNEIRNLQGGSEVRGSGTGKDKKITGYCCTWNNMTSLGEFDEVISPMPFSSLDTDDVVLNLNHDESLLLGRKGVNLELTQDDVGLRFSCTLNDSTVAQDTYENLKSGILSECSFAFTVRDGGESWMTQANGRMLRVLKNLQLWDAAVVTKPAYGGTSAAARNVIAADIQQRMARATLAADVAARKARVQVALADHEAWKANQVSEEMADIERLRTRRDNLFN